MSPLEGLNLLFGGKVYEPDHAVDNLNNGAAIFANVAIVLAAPSKVTFTDIDNKNLKQLFNTQGPPSASDPHQDASDNLAKLLRHLSFNPQDESTVSVGTIS